MVRPLYKGSKNVASLLTHILMVIMVVMLATGMSGCRKKVEHDSGYPNAAQDGQVLCGDDWVKTLESCPAVRQQGDREHMIAVLREQMNGLSEQDKQRRCQELKNFWQVACGVTPTR